MREPQSMSEGSVMPPYPILLEQDLDTTNTAAKINAMITLGVPYEKGYAAQANQDLMKQAQEISANLATENIKVAPNKEIIALIAYLQHLGKDISKSTNTPLNR
jgi:cytochrome c oxidase cbb3-type subunit I/II